MAISHDNPKAVSTYEQAYTRHVEAREQGGAGYKRCVYCGVEAVNSIDWELVEHRRGCPER